MANAATRVKKSEINSKKEHQKNYARIKRNKAIGVVYNDLKDNAKFITTSSILLAKTAAKWWVEETSKKEIVKDHFKEKLSNSIASVILANSNGCIFRLKDSSRSKNGASLLGLATNLANLKDKIQYPWYQTVKIDFENNTVDVIDYRTSNYEKIRIFPNPNSTVSGVPEPHPAPAQ